MRGGHFPASTSRPTRPPSRVTLTIDRGDMAISNGRVISDTPGPGPGQHTVKFSTSPKMSSYLVAMAVGDFECLEGAADGTPIRVCTPPGKKELGRIALESAQEILTYLQRVLHHQLPVRKTRHAGGARLRRERDGEHRGDLLPRDAPCSPTARPRRSPRARTSPRRRARGGPSVVRQSRHHAVVGRPVAERGLRDLDGNPSAGRVPARSGTLPSTKRAPPRRRSTSIRCGRRAPSTPRCGRRPRSRACSTPFPTRRAPPSSG